MLSFEFNYDKMFSDSISLPTAFCSTHKPKASWQVHQELYALYLSTIECMKGRNHMKVIAQNSLEALKNEEIDPALGQRIRSSRREHGWTIKDLSQKVGISTTHLTRLELGQRRADSMALLTAFSDTLNIPMEELLRLAGQDLKNDTSYVKLAFPGITTEAQKQAVTDFARLITSASLTDDEISAILLQATALAEYFNRRRLADVSEQ